MHSDMKYTYEGAQKVLSVEEQNFLCSFVAEKWDSLDLARIRNLQINNAVENAVIPKSADKGLNMPEVYEIKETYKAHLWKSWFSSLDNMFDVQGKSFDDHQRAALHKALLVDIFRKINLASKLDKGLENWITKGEFICFVNWAQKYKKKRRLNQNTPLSQRNYVMSDVLEYDGPDLTVVLPENFVFDNENSDFDACTKIHRSYEYPEILKENDIYVNTLNIETISKEKSDSKGIKDGKVELLEIWGDIRLQDGTLLKNMVVTVAGRNRIIRIEENPFILNPFVYAAFLDDPTSGRGISPLFVAISLNKASETILNLQLDALKLIINKPYLAPRGSLSGNIVVKEGSIIEYDPALMPQTPIPLDFKDAIVGWDFLKFFESKIESTTGIFKYMTGTPDANSMRTATEATGIISGQNVRLSKEVDMLNIKVKVPLIRKIAELVSNFYDEEREIKVIKSSGEVEFLKTTEDVTCGHFDYVIGDSSSITERKMKLKEAMSYLWQFSSNPEVAPKIKWLEVMKWTLEQLGITDPSLFINDEV